LDKVEKKAPEELRSEYAEKGFEGKQLDEVLAFGRLRGAPDEFLAKASELKLESVGELRILADDLDSRGLKNVEYNMSIVRGIDYYTGIVFEAADTKNPRLGSLFGGGRYDALPKIFGRPDLSATGAAGGIERTAMSLGEGEGVPVPIAYVALAGTPASSYALRVQKALRQAGVSCEAPLGPKSLSKQMEDASRLGVAWTLVVGEKEAKSGSVTLRNMKTGKEELLPLSEALNQVGHA
ncbi:MAG TPA: His/Gly/Thr/Pro-type tRNA ligase C-terminal domain-containing protein, partial [Nitrososphaerales archaeon]|nr:His/Gly/Thr/Pro-type tRNA ligase C-terminal domain-containing protein [Nitrososphaerales archaeon]